MNEEIWTFNSLRVLLKPMLNLYINLSLTNFQFSWSLIGTGSKGFINFEVNFSMVTISIGSPH